MKNKVHITPEIECKIFKTELSITIGTSRTVNAVSLAKAVNCSVGVETEPKQMYRSHLHGVRDRVRVNLTPNAHRLNSVTGCG